MDAARERVAERHRVARDVFRSLDGVSPCAVGQFAGALKDAGPPFGFFSNAFSYLAENVEQDEEPGVLALISMSAALSRVAIHYPSALDRLEGVEGPPWGQLRSALVATRDAIAADGGFLRNDDLPPSLPSVPTVTEGEWET